MYVLCTYELDSQMTHVFRKSQVGKLHSHSKDAAMFATFLKLPVTFV